MNSNEAVAVLHAMLDSVPAGISYWDRQSLNRFANHAFLEWFGVTRDAIAGRHLRDIIGEQWFARIDGAFADGLAGKRGQLETSRHASDGVHRTLDMRFVPHLHDGEVRGLVVLASDVTASREADNASAAEQTRLRLLVDDERQRRETSELANKAKSEFLASMSHEIRTPMNAVLGLSYLALQYGLDDKPRGYIHKVHRAAENLLGILNEILDFSKVEAGEMKLEHEPFALADVLDRVMETAGVKAHAKSLQFTLEVEPEVPNQLIGDAMRLGQVLLNLCDNAIKFTELGAVVVRVESMQQLGKRTELLFSVADTGAGIASDKQGLVFNKFAQVDPARSRSSGGTGLGLSICRQLVNLMGGHLGVESQPGSGSTFHFNALFESVGGTLADGDPAKTHSFGSAAGRPQALRGAKVLLAEDNEVNQLVACEMLRGAGIEVLVADNGRQALEILKANPEVKLVLMDCYMPVMDGFAATRAIRSLTQFHTLPVVAMTANVLPEDLLKCRGVGMNDHVGKPFRVDELFGVLTRWLKAGR